jgi:hypothetical protein
MESLHSLDPTLDEAREDEDLWGETELPLDGGHNIGDYHSQSNVSFLVLRAGHAGATGNVDKQLSTIAYIRQR